MSDLNEQLNLAACPFCGGRADTDFIEGASYIIECSICGSHTGFEDSPADAVAAWNRRAPAAAPAPVAAITDERQRFEAWVTRDMGPIGTKRSKERCPFEPEEYSDRIMQGRWEDWQEAARAALAAAPAAAPIVQPDDRLNDVLRDMLAIQEACGLHTDEYAPGSVIEYIKELESDSTPASSTAAAKDAARWRETLKHVGGMHTDVGAQRFTLRYLSPLEGANIMRGGVAGHFTQAIDAAIASSAGEVKP